MRPCRGSFGLNAAAFILVCALLSLTCGAIFADSDVNSEPGLPQNCHWLPGPEAVRSMPLDVMDPNPESVRLRYYEPPIEFSTIKLNGQDFQTVRLTGEGTTLDLGAPELPKVARLIMIGNTGNVELKVLRSSYHIEKLSADIAPAQPLAGDESGAPSEYAPPKSSLYATDGWYPSDVARISEPATLRDVRFTVVNVYPVQVNPVTREIRVYDEIEVQVVNSGGSGANEIYNRPTSIDPTFKKLYRSFENFGRSSLDELPEVPGEYLVICRNYTTVSAQAQRLVDWHKRKGMKASLAYCSSGYDSVRSIIQTRWTQSGGKLAYVSVLGDPQSGTVDTFYIATHGSQYDNYLATTIINPAGPNPDPVPDVAVGRITATSSLQLQAVIDKTIMYEASPYIADPIWFTQTWCASHTAHAPNNPSFKRYTEAIMTGHGIQTVFWNEYSNSTTLQADINSRLAAGISVFNHRMSYISEMSTSHLSTVSPNQMWPFVMSITCNTGTFSSGTAVSEAWLMPTGQVPTVYKGAIGCVGMATSLTNTRFNNALDAGAMYGLYVRGIHEQGAILIAGKLEMYRNYYDDDPTNTAEFCWYANLMGDPAVPIWTARAWPLTAAFADTIRAGTNHVRVTVRNSASSNPVPDALVCLWKGTESYSRGYTNSIGEIDLPCTTATAGSMLLTASKENLAALLDTMQVISSTAWLAYDSVSVDDDNIGLTSGDNNRIISPGETVELSIRLRNSGTSQTVTGINGTLTCAHPGIQMLSAASAYANIAAGSRVSNTTPFRIQVSSVFNLEPVTFYLNLTSSIAPETVRVDLTPRAPDVAHRRSTFSGGAIDPGENGDLTVIFKNTGLFALENAHAVLRSLDPNIEVTDSVGEYGNVAASAYDSNNTDRFHINVSNGTFPGRRAVMQLLITDDNGFRDSTNFDSTNFFVTDPGLINRDSANFLLTISTRDSSSPTGPDAHGYYAYDNLETHPAACSTSYQWTEIIPGSFGGSGTSLGFSDTQENYDASSTIPLPFEFKFYGISYDQITVCSNGWLAFGSTLNHDAHNYRMGTPPGPPNQVAAYWDDLRTSGTYENVYYWYDAVNFRFIVEWRARLEFESTHDLEKFEIILYDPSQYPSATGNGKIKIQYDSVAVKENYDGATNGYCTAGIQNADHSVGLDYYYWNSLASGSSSIRKGRAIMFTTDATGQLSPTITLSQPIGSENWFVGQSYNILWQSAAVQGGVTIEIKRNYPSGSWIPLFTNITNDGVQPWTVDSPTAAGTARIRVFSFSSPSVCDTSAGGFSIIMPTVTLTAPNGGDTLRTGNGGYISWNSVGMSAVKVELNRSYPSLTWEVVRESVSYPFEWLVSGPPTANARMRITGISVTTVGDTSDANFIIGLAPYISHEPHADQALGTALFVADVTDDDPSFTTKLFYRVAGGGAYDSVTFSSTGNPDEYSATTPALSEAQYEYYLRTGDPQGFVVYEPDSGTYRFDVGPMTTSWIAYDDGSAENYNWVDGTNYQWAVKFDPGTYPYALFGARFAICPTCGGGSHQPIQFRVLLADGAGGMPGTAVFSDTTACASNVIGGLPAGAAWADVITRSAGQPLQLNGAFYLSVQNPEIREHPVAFANDTLGTRNHHSYYYDGCEEEWFSEDAATESARPGNRLIRANGFPLSPLQVVVYRSDSAGVASAMLKWTSTGAPYYHIYSATDFGGSYSTLEGSIAGPAVGQAVYFRDVNAVGEAMRRFYRVYSSDQP